MTTSEHRQRGFLFSLLTLLTLVGAIDHPAAALFAAKNGGSPEAIGHPSELLRQQASATGVATEAAADGVLRSVDEVLGDLRAGSSPPNLEVDTPADGELSARR